MPTWSSRPRSCLPMSARQDRNGEPTLSNDPIIPPTSAILQDAVLDSKDVSEFLDQLCQHAVDALSDGDDEVLCGIDRKSVV